MDEWLTLEEIAEALKVHIETVRGWVRSRKLHAVKLGRDYRVRRSDLEKFLQERSNTNEDK